jgi:beta-propeller repeat-containing protein
MENSKRIIYRTILTLGAVAVLAWQPSVNLPRAADHPLLRGDAVFAATSRAPRVKEAFARSPLLFEANQGQTDSRVRFLSRGNGYTLFLTGNEAVLSMAKPLGNANLKRASTTAPSAGDKRLATLRMTLVGANPAANVAGVEELPGKSNYFIGNDPKKWRTNVPTYAEVRYRDVYPGVDLFYYGNEGGQLEYDFVVAPGADPKDIRLDVEGGLSRHAQIGGIKPPLHIDARGDLIVRTDGGDIRFQKPVVYQQDIEGRKQYIDGRYALQPSMSRIGNPKLVLSAANASEISFEVESYDHSMPLVIDPAIAYSTFLGGVTSPGSYGSEGEAIATYTDPSTGHVYAYVTGSTSASDFPTVNALQNTSGGRADAFVTKFDPAASGAASVIYSTYLGGTNGDGATGIAVDSSGDAYISGLTASTDFPTMNAYQTVLKSPSNAFLSKLSADGSTLFYSTYFGGSVNEGSGCNATAVALDFAGRAYIAGCTQSPDLPTVNPYKATLVTPGQNAFVAELDTTKSGMASLVYSTFLGGSGAFALAVDAAGMIHWGGYAAPANFPIVNGFQTTATAPTGTAPVYAKLNPSLSGSAQLVYSTYLGNQGGEASALALDTSGNAYLTLSGDVPGHNSVGPIGNILKINSALSGAASLVYSAAYPGAGWNGIAVDSSGDAFVVGSASPGLPLVKPVMGSTNGVFQTLNAGQSWTGLTQGITDFPINALAVDVSTSPLTLYAGTGHGTIFSSTDGGLNWNRVFQAPSSSGPSSCSYGSLFGYSRFFGSSPICVMAVAVDPNTPSNVYAGTSAGVYKSSDRGSTWNPFNTGLSSTAVQQGVRGLTFDGSTLYAGAGDGLYVLNPGTTSWNTTTLGADVENIIIDPNPATHTIYTDTDAFPSLDYKSTDGGATWKALSFDGQGGGVSFIAVDAATTPSTLYGYDPQGAGGGIFIWKSVDQGNTWNPLNTDDTLLSGQEPAATIYIDMKTKPSGIYVRDIASGISKSTDSGNSWTTLLSAGMGSMAADPTSANGTTPITLYTGTGAYTVGNAFVEELNPSGSAIIFSTYLGGLATNASGNGIAIDGAGNIYVAGGVSRAVVGGVTPLSFPTVNAYQTTAPASAAFFTEVGSQTLPTSSSGSVTAQVVVQTGTLAITFPSITGSTTSSAPTLTVTPLTSTTTANFSLSNNLGAYDISTTAEYSGSVTLCFQALTVNDPGTFSNLEILHIVNGTPVNVTTSYDFSTRTICGSVTSFSPFVLVKGPVGQLYDLIREVNECNLRHGIQSSLDAKLQNAIGTLQSANQNDAMTAFNMMGAFINSVQAQAGQAITLTEATRFVAAAKQIQATLGFVP